MGRRGPAPKPTALRALHGDKPYRLNSAEPQPRAGLPPTPDDLSPSEVDIWSYVVAELAHMGLAKAADMHQLRAYVAAVAEHADATVGIQKAGYIIKTPDGEGLQINPFVAIREKAARRMLVYAREFGLTPASRVQLKAEQVAEDAASRLLG